LILRILNSIPPSVLTLFMIAVILMLIDALLWLRLRVKIALRVGMLWSFLLAQMWWIYSYEDGQVAIVVLVIAFLILATITSILIVRLMSSQAQQLREYRARAEDARQRGDFETATLHEQTAAMVGKTLIRTRL
jgi:hypothetical protein